MANLTLTLSNDYSSTVLSDITEITLNGFSFLFSYVPASITLAASQFDDVQVHHDVVFDTADGYFHTIYVIGGSVDASTWTFSPSAAFGVSLSGGGGADTIIGSSVDDVIDGGAGGDALNGGGGINTLSYASSMNGVTVNLATGAASRGDAAGDAFLNFQNLTGSNSGDVLVGDSGANNIYGGTGNDTITGGAGGDTMNGGSDGGDTLSYVGSAGVTINLLLGTASGGDATNDDYTGFANVIGGNAIDHLTGDGNANVLRGNGGNDVLSGGFGNDSLFGGLGNDKLVGGEDNDKLQGDGGIDRLTGGAGVDTLTGGTGSDTFVFLSLTDSGIGVLRDTITDFQHGVDHIDLSAIDAIVGSGNDVFTFIGGATFSGTDGELRYSHVVSVSGNYTIINMDTDGDGASNAQIALLGTYTLTAADFVL